jgi:hypothetical protein
VHCHKWHGDPMTNGEISLFYPCKIHHHRWDKDVTKKSKKFSYFFVSFSFVELPHKTMTEVYVYIWCIICAIKLKLCTVFCMSVQLGIYLLVSWFCMHNQSVLSKQRLQCIRSIYEDRKRSCAIVLNTNDPRSKVFLRRVSYCRWLQMQDHLR